jgi:hypothetical protein
MVELQPSKLATWVRFPSPAPAPILRMSEIVEMESSDRKPDHGEGEI